MTEQSFKDRSGALMAMGIIEILGGVVMALFSVLMATTLLLKTSEVPLQSGLSPALIYAALSAWLLVMGIGTLRAARWARLLMLSASWFSLVTGIVAMAFMAMLLPEIISSSDMPKEITLVVMMITGVACGIIYLILPLIGVLFYSGLNVRATFEVRHPTPSRTERCPQPVLIMALLMGMSVFSGVMQITANFVHPFFGTLLSGTPGLIAWTFNSLFCVLIAVGLYKLKPAAWWGVLIYYALLMLSSILTFSRITMDDFYTAANYPESLRTQMQNFHWMDEMWFIKIGLLFVLPSLIYLLFIKRYFEQPKSEEYLNDR
jgi:hypothetical protein